MKEHEQRTYYPALDGLRGIAILLVLYFHLFPFLPFAQAGWAGVDLFFVLSGFLITDILLRTRNNKNYYRSFIIRRALRILPAYYLCLVVFPLIFSVIPQHAASYHYFRTHELIFWIQGQNWLFVSTGHEYDGFFFSHLWSIAVEEQYYLFWPVVVLLIKDQKQLQRFLIGLIILYIVSRFAAWAYWKDPGKSFSFQTFTRGDGLCTGSLIAIWKRNNIALMPALLRFMGIVLAFELCFLVLAKTGTFYIPHFYVFGYTLIAAVFAVAVAEGLKQRNLFIRFLTIRPLRFIGRISYGLYLYHFPLFLICETSLRPVIERSFPSGTAMWLSPLAALALSLIVSLISYFYVERFFLKLKSRFQAW